MELDRWKKRNLDPRRLRHINLRSSKPLDLGNRARFLMAEATAHHRGSSEVESTQIDDFFKAILASKALRSDEKKELEVIARLSAEHRSQIGEAQSVAAQQARKTYRCMVCGLEFFGILSFTDHNESTSHMKNQGTPW